MPRRKTRRARSLFFGKIFWWTKKPKTAPNRSNLVQQPSPPHLTSSQAVGVPSVQTVDSTATNRQSSPNQRPPFIKTHKQRRLIDIWWQKIFCDNENLTRIANGNPIRSDWDRGLVYCYLVDGVICYVGKTKQSSLKRRMTRKHPNSKTIGYNYFIKRNMLNAYRKDLLRIGAVEMAISDLDAHEQFCIRLFGQQNRLWNQEYNENFQKSNYYQTEPAIKSPALAK